MRAFRALLMATLREFLREPAGLSISVVLPLMFVVFFGVAYSDQALPGGSLRQIDFVVPGVLGLGLMWLGIFAAIPLAAQRELGILRRIAVTPTSRFTLVAAQVVARLLVSLVQAALVLLTGRLLFGVPLGWGSGEGSVLGLALVTLFGALTFVTLGYAIAAIAPTQPAAHGWAQLVSMPMVFLAGVFFPLSAMPDLIRPVVLLLPLTYLADALRAVALGPGAGAFPLALDLAVLAVWSALMTAVAVRWFRAS